MAVKISKDKNRQIDREMADKLTVDISGTIDLLSASVKKYTEEKA